MDDRISDNELARRAREGDRDALSDLVERTRTRLFALAYAELRRYDDAQDAVASALVRICLRISDLRETDRVRPWMSAIVRNEARLLRRKRDSATFSLEETAEIPAKAENALLRLEIERALRSLPADHSRTVALHYLAGLSIHDIASRLRRPEGTVKRWLHFGRKELAAELGGYAMPETYVAACFHAGTNLAAVSELTEALKRGGFEKVLVLDDFPAIVKSGAEDAAEFHLASSIANCRFFIFEERIGGRSAFELHTLVKATAEGKGAATCLLAPSPVSDQRMYAAWIAGFDLFLSQPVNPSDFENFARRIRESLDSR
jgi:RNA polymerase sigma-70 factor (ECF subfamily)